MSNEYIPSYLDQEGQNQDQNNQNFPQQPGTAGSVPVTPSSGQQPQRKASTGFTNLKNYVQANKANTLGQTIASKAQQQVDKAQQNIQSSEQKFSQAVEDQKQKLASTADVADKSRQYVETGDVTKVNPQLQVQPEATAEQKTESQNQANEQARANLAALRDYQYTGPRNLENEQQLVSDKFQIQDFAKATGSEAGRGAILQTQFGGSGQYGSGMRNLDNLMLSSSPDDLSRLKDIRTQARGYDQKLRDLLTQAQSKTASMQGNVEVEKAKQAVDMNAVRDRVKNALTAEADQYNQQMKEDIASITPEELAQYIPNFTGWDLVNPEDV